MPEPKTKRVLLCGGHLDGRWVDAPEGAHIHRAVKPQSFTLAELDPELVVFPDVVEYELEPLPIKIRSAGGGRLWVGAIGFGPERDETILRALFQRDVAQQLLGGVR